jgi:hypothetical protein
VIAAQVAENRNPGAAQTAAQKPAATGNPCLQALLPALHRLDQLLEWAVDAMQLSGRQVASPPWRGLYIDDGDVRRLLAQAPAESPFPANRPTGNDFLAVESPLSKIVRAFQLSSFDADLTLLAAAPELDLRYERLYAYLQDDITRKRPTVELALNLLCSTAEEKLDRRIHLEAQGPLVRHGLLVLVADPSQTAPPFLAHYLKLDNQIIRFLLGQPAPDGQLAGYCDLIEPSLDWDGLPTSVELRTALPALLKQHDADGQGLRLYFRGAPGAGKRKAAEALAGTVGTVLLAGDLTRIVDAPDFEQRLNCLLRETLLRGCLPYLSGMDAFRAETRATQRDTLLQKLASHPGSVILAGTQPLPPGTMGFAALTVAFGIPEFEERRASWQAELSAIGVRLEDHDLDGLAGRFRLTAVQIKEAVAGALHSSEWRAAKSSQSASNFLPTLDELYAMSRAETGHHLEKLARRITPRHGWDEIVLPADQLAQLREICFQAEYRHVVYDAWGFDRKLSVGKGLNVLFYGPPGTGKTMSAEVIARDLRLDLYRIDLSQIISKYIGETEKNLDQIFTAAEDSNAILFFDEADALFGKRSEVRDSHDRYANIEISYLLQKMEEYQGVSILATNLRQNLDEAFVRRLQAIVEFPFPDEEHRRRIWQLAFPREAPLSDDVEFESLAREVRLAGGNIKNMALAAAFFAAADGGTIRMAHLVQAARREHQKLGRAWNDTAFRPEVKSTTAA